VALMFLTGDGMRGGRLHGHIAGSALIGERRTLPRYRFYSIRDEFPALCPAGEGGQPIAGELYDVPMNELHRLLGSEPPELELSIVALAPAEPAPGGPAGGQVEEGELSFGMILRRGERERGVHADITRYGGWRAYRHQH
jgi:Allophanate hydrolase C-terminal domain